MGLIITNPLHKLLSDNITTVSGNLSTLSGTVTTIGSDLDTLEGNVSTLSGTVTTIGSDLDTLEGNVSTLSGTVTTIGSDLDTVEGNVSAIQTAISNGTIVEKQDLRLTRYTQTETIATDTDTLTLSIPEYVTDGTCVIDIYDNGALVNNSNYSIVGTTITFTGNLLATHVIKIIVNKITTV